MHGQTLWIGPKAGMVIARFASHPVAAHAANDPTSLPAYCAVADPLMANDKTPLLGAEREIEAIAGAGVIDNSCAMLLFMPDGRLAGNAIGNRPIGSYKREGGTLKISQIDTTMMACPEALMDQEHKLRELLPKVNSYRTDDTGALLLSATDGKTIKARR